MKNYHVEFSENGIESKWQTIQAGNPGQAFFKCKKAHPKAVLKRCELGPGSITYDAPKNQAMPSKPRPDDLTQTMMTFYATCLSRKPIT
jgi:hypothetical protein